MQYSCNWINGVDQTSMSTMQLLRHGQAAFGAERYDQLSDLGARQSARVGEWIGRQRHVRFDAVIVGPRVRHRKTAQIALESLDHCPAPTEDIRLDEFAEGQEILAAAQARQGVDLTGPDALRGKAAARHYATEIQAWAEARTEIPGVASAKLFRRRIADWRDELMANTKPGRAILAVTSGGVIAALVAEALDLPDAHLASLMAVVYNASLTEFAFSDDRPASLVTFNAAGHLEDSLLTRV